MNCKSNIHREQLEEFTVSILEAMESAGRESLPFTFSNGPKKQNRLPGWKDYVQPYADESRFWYNLWASAGKPRTGELFVIMKSKKSQYKFAVRRLKRCSDIITNDKLIESLIDSDKNIFEEVRKLRQKGHTLSSRIDDKVEPDLIASHFSEIYQRLFNNIDEDLGPLHEKVSSLIGPSMVRKIQSVDCKTVRDAVRSMKPNKRDSVFDVTSDMYRNSPDIFYDQLTIILQQSLVHGILPSIVLLCTLMPLVKNSLGDITRSDN